MNETIKLMQSHRSIRKYTSEPVSYESLEAIIKSAQSAATSSHLQCVSVIRIVDKSLRQSICTLSANQEYIVKAPEFLLFCADFNRHQAIVEGGQFGFAEQLMLGCIDAGLMGQNAMLAAESLGLGAVFIGAVRNNPLKIVELLKLPEQVFPLFGLCLGYPAQQPELKPRLPLSIVMHDDYYQPLSQLELEQYDKTVRDYYQSRTDGKKSSSWSEEMQAKFTKESRPHMQGSLKEQGFNER